MPKLTIITVNLNNAEGLRKTLDSVSFQTYTNYEHLIIDGGSTDGSVDFIKEYEANYHGIKHGLYWASEPDRGIYNAMNKGIKVAKGEYCLFLNSGDWLVSSTTIEKTLPSNSNYDIIINELEYLNSDNILTKRSIPSIIDFHLLAYSNIPHCSTYIKRELFKRYGLYNENYKIVSDHLFFLQLLILHKVSYHINHVTLTHFDTNGISSNRTHMKIGFEERIRAQNEVLPNFVWQFATEFKILEQKFKGLTSSKSVVLALKISSIFKKFLSN